MALHVRFVYLEGCKHIRHSSNIAIVVTTPQTDPAELAVEMQILIDAHGGEKPTKIIDLYEASDQVTTTILAFGKTPVNMP
jgi:hypothetical protein